MSVDYYCRIRPNEDTQSFFVLQYKLACTSLKFKENVLRADILLVCEIFMNMWLLLKGKALSPLIKEYARRFRQVAGTCVLLDRRRTLQGMMLNKERHILHSGQRGTFHCILIHLFFFLSILREMRHRPIMLIPTVLK